MLNVLGPQRSRCCNGTSRRDVLKVGALGATGLMLPDLLRARAALGKTGESLNDKTVIWLFLSGGPTQFETFDPKPDNPLPYRSTVGTLKTNVPGTHIGGLFPNLAQLADKYSIIRSFAHTAADHTAATHWLSTGHDHPPAGNGAPPIQPSIGSILSRYRGPNHSTSGMPTYVGLDQVLAGGGMQIGKLIGESTAKGDVPLSGPVSPNDLLATLFQFLGMPLDLQYTNQAGRPTNMLEIGKPIAELF